MSAHAIRQYHSEVEKIIHFGGTKKETAIRNAFYQLLNEYAKQKGLMLITEITIKTPQGKNVTPDGTLKDSLRQDWGYWESKDEADDIDEEIAKKFAKDYPNDNILFEDSNTAVLYQHGAPALRVSMKDEAALDRIIRAFIDYERPEVKNFRDAIAHFKEDIPKVTEALRDIIDGQATNPAYVKKRLDFLALCKEAINPEVNEDDVREMMIQHILTADIFNTIFDEPHFHQENNVAKELERVVETFFTGALRRQTLNRIKHYYDTINAAAAGIADHHEKQKFLKVVYETFYKSYNPKAADRLGVVYTPNEIVRFMIESTDYLLHKHFGKFLEDKGVEILDPATGTGTFICDIIDHIRKEKLEYKYRNEIHANEVAILPYYISNLNIEFTYKQKMGQYAEFEHLCFMDTLDNLGFKRARQNDLFNPFTEENSKRIMRQNSKKMMVVIGNPPYNANQQNENDNNKNREYPEVDNRIKETFVKNSTAQKTKVYDMYSRFYRWAMDRIDDKGIIAYITNNSFINSRTFDGFRKTIHDEFQFAYIIDLGGSIYELSGKDGIFLNEKHTIFGEAAAVGIAIMFLIKDKTSKGKKCVINYIHPTDIRATRDEKVTYLSEHKFPEIAFDHIIPDKNNNWINLTDNDWDTLIAVADKKAKAGKTEKAIFRTFSTGINSGRDEWVIDSNEVSLAQKMTYYIDEYRKVVDGLKEIDNTIKWSRNIKRKLDSKRTEQFEQQRIIKNSYRPFINNYLYNSHIFVDERSTSDEVFGKNLDYINRTIGITGPNSQKPFLCLGLNNVGDYHFVGAASSSQFLPLYYYDKDGREDNITDWSLNQFSKQYKDKKITKEDIFYYTYAVLHNPAYREKYALNLKRDFPRIPFYKDFYKWRDWGKKLMELHIGYEAVNPYALKQEETGSSETPKTKLKADKTSGIIVLDNNTVLKGIPAAAWEYKLGNRSALEWILDQYKESKPKDPTIAEKFNTYKFADYKDKVIDLLNRVTTVSVETMKIIDEMKKEKELQ